MAYNELEKYIASLSEDERIRFKDLIDECIGRDLAIERSAETARQNLTKLVNEGEKIAGTLSVLEHEVKKLSDNVFDLYLKTVPVEDLFKPKPRPGEQEF